MTSLVAISNLCKSFPGRHALHDAHLEIVAGEVRALMGADGAGKSTLMKIPAGVCRKRETPATAFNVGAAAAAF